MGTQITTTNLCSHCPWPYVRLTDDPWVLQSVEVRQKEMMAELELRIVRSQDNSRSKTNEHKCPQDGHIYTSLHLKLTQIGAGCRFQTLFCDVRSLNECVFQSETIYSKLSFGGKCSLMKLSKNLSSNEDLAGRTNPPNTYLNIKFDLTIPRQLSHKGTYRRCDSNN